MLITKSTERPSGRIKRIPHGALALSAGLVVGLAGLTGCEVDSFLDPSIVGRWEHTPTIMPIQTRIASIEDDTGEYVQTTSIQPGDLIPDANEHRFGPGDVIEIRIRDFFTLQSEERLERLVDRTGYIDITRLGSLLIEGKTVSQAREMIEKAIRDARIQDTPVVSVTPLQQRRLTFSVIGAVVNPGQYFLATRDYRLLEGITAAGGMNETIPNLYVIRQEFVGENPMGVRPAAPDRSRRWQEQPPANNEGGENLIDLIDDLTKPAPAVVGHRDIAAAAPIRANGAQRQPPIDIPDATSNTPTRPMESPSPRSNWTFQNGQWVQNGAGVPEGADPMAGAGGDAQVVQRVIAVPVGPLLAGQADVNIVLRPSDVVRVPPPKSGLVYISGSVARPGPYGLPAEGQLTLLRALASAGGLNGLAIPERVDLTRVVGKDRQATIRLNLRAIAEQTQPDILLKPDDMVNVGTNFWAYPLAIFRGGFRASYGFGFILDRNFAGDVFGADQSFVNN